MTAITELTLIDKVRKVRIKLEQEDNPINV